MNGAINLISEAFSLDVANTEGSMKLLSQNPLIQQFISTENLYLRTNLLQKHLHQRLSAFQKEHSNYTDIRIVIPNESEPFLHTNRKFPQRGEANISTDLLSRLIKHESDYFQLIHSTENTHKPMLYTSLRLLPKTTPHRKESAYLIASLELDRLSKALNTEGFENLGNTIITNHKGDSFIRKLKNREAQVLSQGEISKHVDPTDFNDLKLAMGAGKIREGTLFSNAAYFASKQLNHQFYLYTWINQSELYQQASWLKKSVLTGMLWTAVTTLLMLIFSLYRYVIAPIKQLNSITQSIGDGDYNTPTIAVNRSDEVGTLAKSIERMKGKLLSNKNKIEHIAYHDALTQLPNRNLFFQKLNREIKIAEREKHKIALLFLDLDNFKWVNDTLGHSAGDQLLIEIASRLQETVRGSDYIATSQDTEAHEVVARLGGDEFIVLLPNCKDPLIASTVASRIIKSISKPYQLAGQITHLGISIGITVYPDDAKDASTMTCNADLAMYHAKSNGKNNFQYFSSSMNNRVVNLIDMKNRLRAALDNDRLSVKFQPIVCLSSNEVQYYEALLRWRDPELGSVLPNDFIKSAEECGLIAEIGEWTLHEVCRHIEKFLSSGLSNIKVAINVSAIQLEHENFLNLITQCLAKYNIPAKHLIIELTENTLLKQTENVIKGLQKIRKQGIQVSLDNFGTGSSSISQLTRLPVDSIKIDQHFIREIHHTSKNKALIIAIINMAKALDIDVIAEGVETQQQVSFLQQNNCHLAQGYYFSKPIKGDEVKLAL